jgi:hypothetical protein
MLGRTSHEQRARLPAALCIAVNEDHLKEKYDAIG